MGAFINIVGQKFGRLYVLQKDASINKRIKWICQCDCGNKISISSGDLRSGNTQSCGCYQKQRISQSNKRYNQYIHVFGENFVVGYTKSKNPQEFIFDLEDFEKIKSYCWSIGGGGRLVARNPNGGTPIKFHRLVLDFPDLSFDIDHINGNQLDNRKINLRICSHAENSRNIKIPKNNSTGYIGVFWRKDIEKYSARILHNNKSINLGCYALIEDAVFARLKKEKELWGDFSPQRYLFEKYNI